MRAAPNPTKTPKVARFCSDYKMSEKEVILLLNFKGTLLSDIFWYEQNRASYAISVVYLQREGKRSYLNFLYIEKLSKTNENKKQTVNDNTYLQCCCYILRH